MYIDLVGLNHRTAPIAIREKLALNIIDSDELWQQFRTRGAHGIVLSTCNRTEVYIATDKPGDAKKTIFDFLNSYLDTQDDTLLKHLYMLDSEAVVKHLFQLSSGLDSMIVGEYEVLGQVKRALEIAEENKAVDLSLRNIFQHAIRVGRRVRSETDISKNALSASSVAVDLAIKTIGDIEDIKMLVIGAGEAGRLVAQVARDMGVGDIAITNRTHAKALGLKESLGVTAIDMQKLDEALVECNCIVTCATVPDYLLDVDDVVEAMQKRFGKRLLIIDISVPRNVSPDVGRVENVFLYNIDDLSKITEKNRKKRETESEKAQLIVLDEMVRFKEWWGQYKFRPLIRALTNKAESIRSAQLEHAMKQLPELTEKQQYNLEKMTKAIVTKILNDPIYAIKANGHKHPDYDKLVEDLFKLNTEGNE
ncbi:MAG: glutamyl-tRNA reductase [Chloroflexi bacterium]|jgi:glutamyl-tRNA reductase|nr:glutamyl-tRNA reductase [Chloroflexota bacterium]MBT7080635.1 glutamyl-tRNA reductase [Chloroflexota bacterium]